MDIAPTQLNQPLAAAELSEVQLPPTSLEEGVATIKEKLYVPL